MRAKNVLKICKVGAENWLVQNYELNKDFNTGEVPDSSESIREPDTSNESDEDDFDYGSTLRSVPTRLHLRLIIHRTGMVFDNKPYMARPSAKSLV